MGPFHSLIYLDDNTSLHQTIGHALDAPSALPEPCPQGVLARDIANRILQPLDPHHAFPLPPQPLCLLPSPLDLGILILRAVEVALVALRAL